jgi:deoxyadenosine/deoxycytidine kinase
MEQLRNIPEDAEIVIMERSIDTSKDVFAKMLYEDDVLLGEEWNMYQKIFKSYEELIEQHFETYEMEPEYYNIHITTSAQDACDRVRERNRDGERISFGYMMSCETFQHQMIKNSPHPTLVVDNSSEKKEFKEWRGMLEEVVGFIKEHCEEEEDEEGFEEDEKSKLETELFKDM